MQTTQPQTRRLSVNAAFLKDIKDDNRELKVLLDKILPLTAYPQTAANHWPEFIELLAELRDQLAFHFSLEEAYGYFEEAILTAPQLSLTSENLRGQHAQLFEQVCELADQVLEIAADQPEKVSRFLKKFNRFEHAFEQHEEAELQLIIASLDDDIGVGD